MLARPGAEPLQREAPPSDALPSAAIGSVVPTQAPAHVQPSLLAQDVGALGLTLRELGEPDDRASMRAKQLHHWIHKRGAKTFDVMSTLPASLRTALAERFSLARPSITTAQRSSDGTRKWLLRLQDGREVETVFIPEEDRGSLCISTQVGCTLSCSFCHTGTMPLLRNLTAEEILGQVLLAKDELDDWHGDASRRLTNVVVMGMGEPLFNYENLVKALGFVLDANGQDLSRRRVTVSTSGVVPRIPELGRDLGTGLAISLHAVRDELRDELVPLNRKWDLAALMAAVSAYPVKRPTTFEYVMLNGVNDSDADARELVRLIREVSAKVNLIPFNPWPGSSYDCSSQQRIRAFAGILEQAGYESPVRTPRGRDILAACGQLKTAGERARRAA